MTISEENRLYSKSTKKKININSVHTNIEAVYDYTFTPNGTKVVIMYCDKLSDEDIAKENLKGDTNYPEATRIGPSTARYNCHSYAWIEQTTNNRMWLEDPSPFYLDGSYEETFVGSNGTIICYYTTAGKLLHSGIVVAQLEKESNNICGDSDTKMVTSKWGAQGLYVHRGGYCPYIVEYNATYVKYFKRHIHNFDTYIKNGSNHIKKCSKCNYSVEEDHVLETHYCKLCKETLVEHSYNDSYRYLNYNFHQAYCSCGFSIKQGHAIDAGSLSSGSQYAKCLFCNGTAKIGIIKPNSLYSSFVERTANGSIKLENGVIILNEKDISDYLTNNLIFISNDIVEIKTNKNNFWINN